MCDSKSDCSVLPFSLDLGRTIFLAERHNLDRRLNAFYNLCSAVVGAVWTWQPSPGARGAGSGSGDCTPALHCIAAVSVQGV